MTEQQIKAATEKFEALIREQSERSDKIKQQGDFVDYEKLDKIIIGVCGGDGIGPIITKESARVLEFMLADEVKAGKIECKVIDGLTIENRVAANKFPMTYLKNSNHVTLSSKDPQLHLRQAIPGPTSKALTLQ